MEFTYESFQRLTKSLQTGGYRFCSYHNWHDAPRCVIYRHDIDNNLQKAVNLARVEQELRVTSTYFVLLTSDFYNVASRDSLEKLRTIQSMGHELGLHFDEKAYPSGSPEETVGRILRERDILASILETPITTVSMHRPSQATLEADLKIPGMVNSYGQTFFHDFKYFSDSRHHWREPVEEVVRTQTYSRLHILTHAFWYDWEERTIEETITQFLHSAGPERYQQLKDNLRDLEQLNITI